MTDAELLEEVRTRLGVVSLAQLQAERDEWTAEVERLKAAHEQDIEAAYGQGYRDRNKDGICHFPNEALARFKAARAAQQKEK